MMRYYYDNPLAAAWMSKKFGMGFRERVNGWRQPDNWTDIIGELEDCHVIEEDRARDKYYIHPDSLHLLEPQEMDLMWAQYFYDGELQKEGFARIGKDKKFEMPWGSMIWNKEIRKIIQRNGIALMWPKSEETENVPK